MQNSYSMYPREGIAGLVYDGSPKTIDSFAAEGSIPSGSLLIRGTDPGSQVKAVAATEDAANIFGIACFEYKAAKDGVLYQDKQTVSVMRSGRVWMNVSGTVTPGTLARMAIVDGVVTLTSDTTGTTAIAKTIVFETDDRDGCAVVTI